ncbi:MAG TPA: hypothetical protein VFG91_08990 [Woeseiaceae bacterium]|nr:hypothetical protein [Woeseiaceae bacterium]
MRLKISAICSAAMLAACLCLPAYATTVLKMTLDDLATRADRVFRGSVVSVEPGSVSVGGGSIPTVTYELLVQEQFKGSFPTAKDKTVVTVTMVGDLKQRDGTVGSMRRLSALPDLPDLRVGHEYLLFTTRPSAGGLSTTVGLGQGAFKIYLSPNREELAANELNNAGLFNGPVSYSTLASAVRAALANQEAPR